MCESYSNMRGGTGISLWLKFYRVWPMGVAAFSAQNKHLPRILEWVAARGSDPIIPFSGAYENELLDMPTDERARAEEEAGVPSAVSKIITTGFK